MATRKKLDALLVQARRIAAHREAGAEREIRRVYRELLKGLLGYIAELHARFADGDGRLDYAALQKAGYEARYIEEIERRIGIASREVAAQVDALIKETYKLAYDSMVQGVMAQGKAPITERFAQSIAITPEQIAKAVNNPIMDLALEKNHRDIMYEIKQAVAVGLMNGDRYASVARRISEHLSADRGAYKRAVRIARTEAHRVREAGNNDAAMRVDEELKAGDSGLRMVKTWRTMKDERVRPQRRRKGKGGWTTRMGKGANHMRLDGQTVLADENFDLKDGHTAPAPGMSGVAGHDINCRCIVVREVMDDAEFFAKTGRHLPGHESVEKSAKSGIINEQQYTRFYDGEDVNCFFYYDDEKRGLLAKKKSEYSKWMRELSNTEREYILDYTAGGYGDLNGYLRKRGAWQEINADRAVEMAGALDSAIAKCNLKSNIIVQRGVMWEALDDVITRHQVADAADLVGKTFHDDGFVSTTALTGNPTATTRPVLFEINVPAGVGRGAYVNELSGFVDGEYEFLLRRGADYTITEVVENEETGQILIKMVMDDA